MSSTPSSASGAAPSPWPSPNATWAEPPPSRARDTLDAAISFLLAPRCVACGEWLLTPTSGPVCRACWRAVRLFTPPLCEMCGAPASVSTRVAHRAGCALCAREPLACVSRARVLGAYEGALRAILHGFKFRRCVTLAGPLAHLARERHADLLADVDAVVPVPLHAGRRRLRGFNQAQEIARRLGPPLIPALRRHRRTSPQASLTASGRWSNVEAAFSMSHRWRWSDRCSVRGKRVVLVDDVWTTGATLSACARLLHQAGASEIRVLAVARTLPATMVVGGFPVSARGAPGMPG